MLSVLPEWTDYTYNSLAVYLEKAAHFLIISDTTETNLPETSKTESSAASI